MALYVYRKKDVPNRSGSNHSITNVLIQHLSRKSANYQQSPAYYSDTFTRVKNLRGARFFRILIPLILILTGFSMLYSQVHPYARHFVLAKLTDGINQEIISAVPQSYEETRFKYITDPGAAYFEEYVEKLKQDNPKVDKFSLAYSGEFYLTIDEIQLYDAPISANVDSSNNDQYIGALSQGLAHMKGTKVPGATTEKGEEVDGNVFVYGHSASGDYAEKVPNDPVTAFTNLFKLNIGDEIVLRRDGVEYVYKVNKIKEISPEDTSVVDTTNGKTLTLMTCSPPGLALRRLVILARETEVRKIQT